MEQKNYKEINLAYWEYFIPKLIDIYDFRIGYVRPSEIDDRWHVFAEFTAKNADAAELNSFDKHKQTYVFKHSFKTEEEMQIMMNRLWEIFLTHINIPDHHKDYAIQKYYNRKANSAEESVSRDGSEQSSRNTESEEHDIKAEE